MSDAPDWSTESALIVDDSRTTRAVLRHLLAPTKAQVSEAADAGACLEAVAGQEFDTILLDLALPDGNGLQLLRKIREAESRSTILMITGSSDIRTATEALTSGADGYIEKRHLLEDTGSFLQVLYTARDHRARLTTEQRKTADLATQSLTDPLTGAYNRRYFDERFASEIRDSRATAQPLAMVIFDIDHFKNINDTYGHPMGDLILQQGARLIASTIRASDPLVRFGGEEFVVLLARTGIQGASILAEKIRGAVERYCFGDGVLQIDATVSVGVAELRPDESGETLLKRADEALYSAKQSGRNRVVKAP